VILVTMLFQMLVMEPWYSVMNTAPTTTTTSTTMSQPVIWSPDLLLRSPLALERTFAILFFMEFSLLSPVIWIAVVLFCMVIPPENCILKKGCPVFTLIAGQKARSEKYKAHKAESPEHTSCM
jgi:hypothetical protein